MSPRFPNRLAFALGLLAPLATTPGAFAQAALVADVAPGEASSYVSGLTVYDDALYFAAAADGDDYGLWRYAEGDGAALVADVNPAVSGLPPERLTVYGGRLFFTVEELLDTGVLTRLWAYGADDGATDGVVVSVTDLDVRSPLVVYDGRLYFLASTEAGEPEAGEPALWAYDAASDAVTQALTGPVVGTAADFAVYDGRLFFRAYAPDAGYELWAFDAATGLAALAAEINAGGDSYPNGLTVYDDRLYFAARDGGANEELWAYDAATGTATLAADITPASNPNGSLPRDLVVYDGRLFFTALGDGYGRELWAYDGATGGASFVGAVAPSGSELDPMAVLDGALFFPASASGEDLALYSAANGAVTTAAEGVRPLGLTAYGGRLYFSGHASSGTDAGRELWAYGLPPTASEPPSAPGAPRDISLATYPNPARGAATVTLRLREPEPVRVAVYDGLGREVAVLHDGPLAAGEHAFGFGGASLPSGLYVVVATGRTSGATHRLTLVR